MCSKLLYSKKNILSICTEITKYLLYSKISERYGEGRSWLAAVHQVGNVRRAERELTDAAECGLPHGLRSGYLGNSWMGEKKIPNCVPLRFTAQGCLWSLKLLQKWKVQTICDRSCAACFSRGRSESKVVTEKSRSKKIDEFTQNITSLFIRGIKYSSKGLFGAKLFPRALCDVCPFITFDSDRLREKQAA